MGVYKSNFIIGGGILPCGVDTSGSAYSDGIKVLSSFAHGEVQHSSNQTEGSGTAAHKIKIRYSHQIKEAPLIATFTRARECPYIL